MFPPGLNPLAMGFWKRDGFISDDCMRSEIKSRQRGFIRGGGVKYDHRGWFLWWCYLHGLLKGGGGCLFQDGF